MAQKMRLNQCRAQKVPKINTIGLQFQWHGRGEGGEKERTIEGAREGRVGRTAPNNWSIIRIGLVIQRQ